MLNFRRLLWHCRLPALNEFTTESTKGLIKMSRYKVGQAGLRHVSPSQHEPGKFRCQVNRKNLKFWKDGFDTAEAAYDYAIRRIADVEGKAGVKGELSVQYDCTGCGYGQPTPFEKCPKCYGCAIEEIVHNSGKTSQSAPITPQGKPPRRFKHHVPLKYQTAKSAAPKTLKRTKLDTPDVEARDWAALTCEKCIHVKVCCIRTANAASLLGILKILRPDVTAAACDQVMAFFCGHFLKQTKETSS